MKFYVQKEKNRVKSYLSITPAQMDKAREQGVPITPNNVNPDLIEDGTVNPQFEIELERQRGVDIAELWQNAESSRKKINSFQKKQSQTPKIE